MNPSWDTVEYASIRFTSRSAKAETPAIIEVRSATASRSGLKPMKTTRGNKRKMRKAPAFTIVAECKRALTGVGPSIAHGSQKKNGAWADFTNAPHKMRNTPRTASGVARVRRLTAAKSHECAALAASGRSYQNPIRRNDDNPTSSQKTNIWRRDTERRMPVIEPANRHISAKNLFCE